MIETRPSRVRRGRKAQAEQQGRKKRKGNRNMPTPQSSTVVRPVVKGEERHKTPWLERPNCPDKKTTMMKRESNQQKEET
jgi:hypothetical protein